jgi:hypothetical protein
VIDVTACPSPPLICLLFPYLLPFHPLHPLTPLHMSCRDGVSHSPAEYASDEDVAASVAALFTYLQQETRGGAKEAGAEPYII